MTNHEPGGRSSSFETHPDADTTPDLLLRGTDHLLAVLPHLLGYRPDHSLVVTATELLGADARGRQRAQMAYTLRIDLPPPGAVHDLPALLRTPLRQTVEAARGQVVLHAFVHDPPDETYPELLLEPLRLVALDCGAVLHDVDVVGEQGRARRRLMVATRRVDEPWVPAPSAADVPAVADLVLTGRAPLPSRAELVATVRRQDERATAAAQLALDVLDLDRARLHRDEAMTALTALADWVVRGTPAPTARQRAWIAIALEDTTVRDALLARWLPQMFRLRDVLDQQEAALFRERVPPWPPGETSVCLHRLLTLAAGTPRPVSAPLLTVTGVLAWGCGQGTLANEACALALEIDPGYRMAALMDEALEAGLRPPTADRRGRRQRRRGAA